MSGQARLEESAEELLPSLREKCAAAARVLGLRVGGGPSRPASALSPAPRAARRASLAQLGPESFGGLLVAGMLAAAVVSCGRPPSGSHSGAECERDADCAGDKAYCGQAKTCVECTAHDECGCHEVCTNEACVPLGATSPAEAQNAHGMWTGVPGQPSYSYHGACLSDDQCEIGEICNGLTGGCVLAADYPVSCLVNPECPQGPDGEPLACDPTRKKCLPAALCQAQSNCCGVENFACDTSGGVCRARKEECTPPATVTSACPFEPQERAECQVGLFCSPLGECVECLCDEDCGGTDQCYADHTCRGENYCRESAECQDGFACDTQKDECVLRCDGDNDCDEREYCFPLDHVCRPRSELPCIADAFDTLGNETAQDALDNAAELPIPVMGMSTIFSDLSLCADDVDWFTMDLQKGDLITIRGSSLSSLEADLTAYSPDGVTELAEGTITDSTPDPLDFTANYDGIYFLEVRRFDNDGDYKLTIERQLGQACEDPSEAEQAEFNNTPATATPLNNPVPADCVEAASVVTCTNDVLKMCVGDVDYYLADVPAGADFTFTISHFSGDLDLFVYGPFASPAEASTDPEFLMDAETGAATTETISFVSRGHAYYLARVILATSTSTGYQVKLTVTPSPACQEDIYDDELSAAQGSSDGDLPELVEDAVGLNDLEADASWIALNTPSGPDLVAYTVVEDAVDEHLRLCRADEDWFRLGIDDAGSLADLPAGRRIALELEVADDSLSSSITMAVGHDPDQLNLGSDDIDSPTRHVVVGVTTGEPYFVRVLGDLAPGSEPVTYRLRATLELPSACDLDGLGDLAVGDRNDTPVDALLLTGNGWPTTAGQFKLHSAPDVSLCAQDNDWYVITVPANARVIARVDGDPAFADLGLALYDGSVSGVSVSPPGLRLNTGVLDFSELPGRTYQRVEGDPATTTAYIQVYNRTGWSLQDYDLFVAFASNDCSDLTDPSEPNDTFQQPADPTKLPTFDPIYETFLADRLSLCGSGVSNEDWFQVPLEAGDKVLANAYYDPNDGWLELYLHPPEAQGQLLTQVDADFDEDANGVLTVQHTVTQAQAGLFLTRVRPSFLFDNSSFYHLEYLVERACVDDGFEPSEQAAPYTLPVAADPLNLVENDRILCNDDDWFELVVNEPTEPSDVRICVRDFLHDDSDIDLAVYDTLTPATLTNPADALAWSATKTNVESVTLGALDNGVYYVRVYLDPRDRVNASYTLAIGEGACP